jgi:hypothetical protein
MAELIHILQLLDTNANLQYWNTVLVLFFSVPPGDYRIVPSNRPWPLPWATKVAQGNQSPAYKHSAEVRFCDLIKLCRAEN